MARLIRAQTELNSDLLILNELDPALGLSDNDGTLRREACAIDGDKVGVVLGNTAVCRVERFQVILIYC
ncbi:hypothetical protein AYJ57_21660 (plasmid) [Salipiger sp. CCB-MM3]|nr:hypothetical protein AYJ57_21660 [Salipiger sp. CCB-MM3]